MSSNTSSTPSSPEMQDVNSLVDPSLLSQVAQTFQERMTTLLSDQERSGSTYRGVFTGRDAVDQLALILNTSDRSLALLMGRSLDAQGVFSDAIREHHPLEDSEEIYHFGGGLKEVGVESGAISQEKATAPSGVWTLLTDCYSPSCSKDAGCYSCLCPHGTTIEQQSRY